MEFGSRGLTPGPCAYHQAGAPRQTWDHNAYPCPSSPSTGSLNRGTKRFASDCAPQVEPTPSWMSNDFALESDVFSTPTSDSAADLPFKVRKVDSWSSGLSHPALAHGPRQPSLADLARQVLVLNRLPQESRAQAVGSWLQAARGLGAEQYNECVQLAVSLLVRRSKANKVRPSAGGLDLRTSLASVLSDSAPAAHTSPLDSQSFQPTHAPSTPMPMLTLGDLEANPAPPLRAYAPATTFESAPSCLPSLLAGEDLERCDDIADLEARIFPRESDSFAALRDLFADEPPLLDGAPSLSSGIALGGSSLPPLDFGSGCEDIFSLPAEFDL